MFVISYSHKDQEFAEKLKKKVETEAGYPTWMDEYRLIASDKWSELIDEAIRNSVGVILIVSEASLASKYVEYEWAFAMGANKRVLPFILEHPRSKDAFHPKIHPNELQYIDYTDLGEGVWEELYKALDQIMAEDHVPSEIAQAEVAMRHYDPGTRAAAIQYLLDYEHDSATRALANGVQSQSPDVSVDAAIALAKKTDYKDIRAIPGLKKALEIGRKIEDVLETLRSIGTSDAIECLANFYWNPHPNYTHLKDRALDRLTFVENPEVMPVLGDILRGIPAGEGIRNVLLDRFVIEKHVEVIPDLIEHIWKNPSDSDNWEFYNSVVTVIGEIGHPSAVAPLIEILQLMNLMNYRQMAQTQVNLFRAILRALENIGGEEVIQGLSEGSYSRFQPEVDEVINRVRRELSQDS